METREQSERLIEERRELESQLQQGDYKIIKCAEAQAVNAEMPYDIATLHQERQVARDRINEIDETIAELELTIAEEAEQVVFEEEE